MGTITVNVNNNVEKRFRERVAAKYGRKKGALGKALSEAMELWSNKSHYHDRCMRLLQEGIPMGGKIPSREEIYDRR